MLCCMLLTIGDLHVFTRSSAVLSSGKLVAEGVCVSVTVEALKFTAGISKGTGGGGEIGLIIEWSPVNTEGGNWLALRINSARCAMQSSNLN